MSAAYALLADGIVFIHSLYVAFTVIGALLILLGGILRWSWIRNRFFRIFHLCAVLFVAAESLLGISCFLTEWEYALRIKAGQISEKDISFVGRLIRSLIFIELPDRGFVLMYTGFGILILALFLLFPPGRGRH
jgi:hypothetical protein